MAPVRASMTGTPERSKRAGNQPSFLLDRTGNLKATQRLLGHASIQTTGDIYTDWDIDRLAETMLDVLTEDGGVNHVPTPFSASGTTTRVCGLWMEAAGIEPA